MLNKKSIIEFIATFGYIGKIKYFPGTCGSLAAYPLWYIMFHAILSDKFIFTSLNNQNSIQFLLYIFIALLFVALLLFVIGVYCSSLYIKYYSNAKVESLSNDPKEVVIDEVVGQFLTITLCIISPIILIDSQLLQKLSPFAIEVIFYFLLPFTLFRIFDILKPWPINWFDRNIHGGIGIMLDDILAAIFSAVMNYAIIIIILSKYSQ
ncbi:MAG: phosphatidylglycerophosphatase A [Rickettsiaceae bacterium]